MKPVVNRRPGDLVFAAILLLLSAWAFWHSYSISRFESLSGPGVFPMLASGIMAICSFSTFVRTLSQRRESPAAVEGAFTYLFPFRFLLFATMMAIFAAAMPWVGFFPAAAGFIFLSIVFLWRRNLFWTALVTVISIGGVYLVFRIVFQVVLPTGALWQ